MSQGKSELKRVLIVGTGLIGASVGLALKVNGFEGEVVLSSVVVILSLVLLDLAGLPLLCFSSLSCFEDSSVFVLFPGVCIAKCSCSSCL